MSDKNSYPASFKQEVLDKIKAGGKPVDVAQSDGINVKLVYNWIAAGSAKNSSLIEINKLKRENQTLKELVGELTMSIKGLKKR